MAQLAARMLTTACTSSTCGHLVLFRGRVYGFGFRVSGFGFRVQGVGLCLVFLSSLGSQVVRFPFLVQGSNPKKATLLF